MSTTSRLLILGAALCAAAGSTSSDAMETTRDTDDVSPAVPPADLVIVADTPDPGRVRF